MKTRTVQLGDVATVFNGKTPSKIEQRRHGFPVLKIRDVNEFGQFTGPFTSFVEPGLVAGLADKLVCDGDTLVLNAAHNADYVASKSFFASGSVVGALATGEWLIVRPDLKEADARFLYFWSLSVGSRNRIRSLVKGIHLYPKDVADIPLALPDLPEQRRIAGQLEQTDQLRRTRRYALELTDGFVPAVFIELFGEYLTSACSSVLNDVLALPLTNGLFEKNSAYGTGVPVIWVDNLYHTVTIDLENLRRARVTAEQIHAYRVMEGDLLFTRSSLVREGIGQINIVPRLPEPALFECHVIRARVDGKKVNPFYVLGLYRSLFGKANILRRANTATMTTISQGALEELPCPLPPLPLQQKFAALVERVERLRAVQREALRQAEHLFASLVRRAFSG